MHYGEMEVLCTSVHLIHENLEIASMQPQGYFFVVVDLTLKLA